MNRRHSPLTDSGLTHIAVEPRFTILDIGCGGGRTLAKLAASATQGKIFGIDYSPDSVAMSVKTNARAVAAGQVQIQQGSVSALPWADNTFDLVTAIETHFFWPDLPGDMRQALRVLRPAGAFLLVAEIYKGATTTAVRLIEKRGARSGMTLLTPDEHRQLLIDAGFANVQVFTDPAKAWICCTAAKPEP
ncbi:MAG TPA: class I SAM-dependent methyltransferase [Acidobacteriaceae bacterium]|nr:class I SAM-dependent methyltransferase [Acidobacteriaceae bacterium]